VQNFDLVYVVALWHWIGIDAARACRRKNVPMVVAIKGAFAACLWKKSYLKKRLFHALFLKRALQSATALHLTNAGERAEAGTRLDGLPFFYCPDAVDPERYSACPAQGRAFRLAWNIPPQAPVVVSVGRPDWKKGVDLLIRALAAAPRWYLVFAGDPESGQAGQWRRLAQRLGVADRVVWPGFLSGPDLLAALSAADLFALVSANENFGMVVAEAMLCGLPVMVSRAVGVWHDIKDQRFTIAVDRQVNSIVAALSRFEQERPGSAIDGASIRRFAIDKYAPPVVARRFLREAGRFLPAVHAPCAEKGVEPSPLRSGLTPDLPLQ
jgi:glycosyltransferase involved in cell wall biosynthesis